MLLPIITLLYYVLTDVRPSVAESSNVTKGQGHNHPKERCHLLVQFKQDRID